MRAFLKIWAFLFLFIYQTIGQSLQILDIDPSRYPEIRMEFSVKDAANKEIRNFSLNDFILKDESCQNIVPKSIFCGPAGQSKFSIILTLDLSTSMTRVFDGKTIYENVVAAAKAAIRALPDPSRWECAIMGFSATAQVFQGFTNDTALLLKKIDTVYRQENLGGQTDHNAGLMYDCTQNENDGALRYAEKYAKYKPIVIFITDGDHNYQNPPRKCDNRAGFQCPGVLTGEIIQMAGSITPTPATLFCLTLGLPMPSCLNTIAKYDGLGEAIASQVNQAELETIFMNILNKAGTLGPPPNCEIKWDACCTAGNVHFEYKPFSLSKDTTYSINDALKPDLQVNPRAPYFENVPLTQEIPTNITLTAKKNNVIFSNPGSDAPKENFSIDWGGRTFPLTLKKDSSITVVLKYRSVDSMCHKPDINFLSSACSGNLFNPSAGWWFIKDVNVGSAALGQERTVTIDGVFCNRTCKTITVNSLNLKGGNFNDFTIISPVGGFTLPSDSCVPVTIKFKPNAEGDRETTLEVVTNYKNLTCKVMGNGSGFPDIGILSKIDFPNANCKSYTRDTVIIVNSTGALPLNITDMTITPNENDFTFVSKPGLPWGIPGNDKGSLTIRFQPSSIGLKNATLNIVSNSKNSPNVSIQLSGTRDSIGFGTSESSLDFGTICPNELKQLSLNLNNTGTVNISVTGIDGGGFILPVKNWLINPAGQQNVNISFSSPSEGDFNGQITFTDDFCSFVKIVNVKAKVEKPKITFNPSSVSVVATVGGPPGEQNVIIQNTSTRDLTINAVNSPDAQITYEPPPPWSIQAGKSITVKVKYTPTSQTPINVYVKLSGAPCNFEDSLNVTGNPDLASAKLEVDKLTSYYCFPIVVPIHLRNPVRIAEAEVSHINTRLSYGTTLLQFTSITPKPAKAVLTGQTLYIDSMDLSQISVDVIAYVTFLVKPAFAVLRTPLDLSNTTTSGGFAVITETDGEISIKPSSGRLVVDNTKAKPGETFELSIYLRDQVNITSDHQNIMAQLIYNAYLFEPVGNTPRGTYQNQKRSIDLTLPVNPIGPNGLLQKLQFRAMLGDNEKTQVLLSNPQAAAGCIDFNGTTSEFTLDGVCKSGGSRLFDPNGKAQIMQIIPNPANGTTRIQFEAGEEGWTRLWISSMLGTNIGNIFEGHINQGIYEYELNTEEISNGAYIIIYQTPTQMISQPLWILK